MPRHVVGRARRTEQVLIRITADELDVLQAAAHLEGSTVNSYAHELLTWHVKRLRDDEFVRRDIDNRRAFRDSLAKVSPLLSRIEDGQGH